MVAAGAALNVNDPGLAMYYPVFTYRPRKDGSGSAGLAMRGDREIFVVMTFKENLTRVAHTVVQ